MENPVDPTGTPDLSINVMVFDIVDVIVNQPAHLAFTTMLFCMLLFYVIFDLIVNIQVWNCESSWRITQAAASSALYVAWPDQVKIYREQRHTI